MKKELWAVIHEYSDRDEEGASVNGIFISYEKACEKAKLLAENEIKNCPFAEEDIYYMHSENYHYISYDGGCYYDNFKVELVYLED